MDQPESNIVPEKETPKETLSRRQLLKVLAATGGAVSASALLPDLLPGKWAKPVVEVGLLPAHAQVTRTPTHTPTRTPQIMCTPPACQPGEVLHCPGECPGGCGYECATPTPGAAANLPPRER